MGLFSKKQKDIPRRRQTSVVDQSVTPTNVFRRNRTIIGSKSNSINSATNSGDFESPRSKVHDLSSRRRKVLSILLIVVVSLLGVWFLISNLTASASVSVSDLSLSKPLNKPVYEKVIQDYLDVNPMSRLSFLMDQSKLSSYVSSRLPEVSSVLQRSMLTIGTTSFVVTMRQPVAGWQINTKQYYVDTKGIAFDKNYYAEPTVQIIDQSGISVKQGGSSIASKRLLSFVGRVVFFAKNNGFTVVQAMLPPDTTRELHVKIKEFGSIVKLSIDRPAGEQVEDLTVAIRYFISRGQTPQYIDVRVGGKAFYK